MLVTSPKTENLTKGELDPVASIPGVPALSILLNEYSSLYWLS